jgi:hypothetical protein
LPVIHGVVKVFGPSGAVPAPAAATEVVDEPVQFESVPVSGYSVEPAMMFEKVPMGLVIVNVAFSNEGF